MRKKHDVEHKIEKFEFWCRLNVLNYLKKIETYVYYKIIKLKGARIGSST